MRPHKLLATVAVAGMLLAVSGCAAGSSSEQSQAPTDADADAGVGDSCIDFGDVLTITTNADRAFREGRMGEAERDGWYRLASRVLDGVTESPPGAVGDAVRSLKAAAPPIPPGAMDVAGIGTDAWNAGFEALSGACDKNGTPLAAEAYTGG